MKAVLVLLGRNRRGQMAFASIICGLYFKYYENASTKVPVQCPICREAKSLEYLLQREELGRWTGNSASEEDKVQYLRQTAKILAPMSPAVPHAVPLTRRFVAGFRGGGVPGFSAQGRMNWPLRREEHAAEEASRRESFVGRMGTTDLLAKVLSMWVGVHAHEPIQLKRRGVDGAACATAEILS